jgi:hypothetical protein
MCGTILASGNSMKTYFSSKEFVIHQRGTVTEQTAPGMGELWCSDVIQGRHHLEDC